MSRLPTISSARHWRGFVGWLFCAVVLTGCAGRTESPAREGASYAVHFSATRTADHESILSASVPVSLGGEGKVKISSKRPAENQPVVTHCLVRLNRTRQTGVYEMVTQVTVREANRNKKGKLKISQRYLGALVPTRLGETQVVSAEGDPIHLEATLERR